MLYKGTKLRTRILTAGVPRIVHVVAKFHLPQHNRTRGGKAVFCMVAVIEDTSEQRAWQQVFRCFPDYTEATSIIRCDNKDQALVRLKDSFGINAC